MNNLITNTLGMHTFFNIKKFESSLEQLCTDKVLELVHQQIVEKWTQDFSWRQVTYLRFVLDSLTNDQEWIERLAVSRTLKEMLKNKRKMNNIYFNEFNLCKANIPLEVVIRII